MKLRFMLLSLVIVPAVYAQTVFTYVVGEVNNDPRYLYDQALLRLALDKTVPEYGEYKLVPAKVGGNTKRNELDAIEDVYPNFFTKLSYAEEVAGKLAYVPIPADRGIVGYRVFFTSEKVREQLKSVDSVEQLKKFSMLQGIGWVDADILKAAGFNVKTGTNYDGMFKMVAVNRVDLFPRGANEMLGEWQSHKDVRGLTYDEALAVYYPMPRFFFTNKKNSQALSRVQKGLEIAYADGSFQDLWEEYYSDSIEMVALEKRRIFRVPNPGLSKLDLAYEKYNYDPEANADGKD